jgi:hypothetical protein
MFQDLNEAMRSGSLGQVRLKLFGGFDRDKDYGIEREIEKLTNLAHLCIAASFGFVLPTASKKMKILKFFF